MASHVEDTCPPVHKKQRCSVEMGSDHSAGSNAVSNNKPMPRRGKLQGNVAAWKIHGKTNAYQCNQWWVKTQEVAEAVLQGRRTDAFDLAVLYSAKRR